jgi:hypothetical protein
MTAVRHTEYTCRVATARTLPDDGNDPRRVVERVQTGVRIERRILQVLKALASSKGMSVGDLLEGIILHAFEGTAPFGPETLTKLRALRDVYGLDLEAKDSHLLVERAAKRGARAARPSSRRSTRS